MGKIQYYDLGNNKCFLSTQQEAIRPSVVRISRKVLLSTLLVLSAIPLLVTQRVSSQSYTTVTSLQTITTQATSIGTSYFTSIASLTSTMSDMNGYRVDNTGSELDLSGTAPLGTWVEMCGYSGGTFKASRGQQIVGTMSAVAAAVVGYAVPAPQIGAPTPISFYLTTSAQWTDWIASGGNRRVPCVAPRYLVKAEQVERYDLQYTLPDDTEYVIMLLNPSIGVVVNVTFNNGRGLELRYAGPVALQSVFTVTLETLQTLTTVRTEEIPFMQAYGSWLIPVVFVAIVVVLFLVLRMRPRKSHRRS